MTTLFDGLNGCSIYIICTSLCSCYMARRNGKKFNNNNACGNIVITLWFFYEVSPYHIGCEANLC